MVYKMKWAFQESYFTIQRMSRWQFKECQDDNLKNVKMTI